MFENYINYLFKDLKYEIDDDGVIIAKLSWYDSYFSQKDYYPPDQWNELNPKLPLDKISKNPLRSFLLPTTWCDKFAFAKVMVEDDKPTITLNSKHYEYLDSLRLEIAENQKKITQLF